MNSDMYDTETIKYHCNKIATATNDGELGIMDKLQYH